MSTTASEDLMHYGSDSDGGGHDVASPQGRLVLDPNRVDVWLTFLEDARNERLLAAYRQILTEAELERGRRFHFEVDRHRHLVTRALVRTTLSRYVPIAASDWSFSSNSHGRPAIDNDVPGAGRISFNVSHTDGLVVLAVGCERIVGVDVENASTRSVALEVADSFFSPAEVAALHALPAELRQERFFRYWTLKESYIKARGLGLAIPLDRFSFHFRGGGGVAVDFAAELGDRSARWAFRQWWASADHLAALCIERTGTARPTLSVMRVVPLHAEERLEQGPWETHE